MNRRFARGLLASTALVAAFVVSGCSVVHNTNNSTTTIGSAPYTEGSGKVATQTRNINSFHAISVENGLTVFVKQGSAASASVTSDDNLVGMIATDVQDGTLRIRVSGSLTTHNQLKVDVTSAAAIDYVSQTGGSTVDVEDLSSDNLTASVEGGSTLRAGGRTANLQLTADGGSTADLRNVEAESARVRVDGGSTAFVQARKAITGACHGGSTLEVSGSAGPDSVEKDTGSTVVKD
jgi:hypothetical protein